MLPLVVFITGLIASYVGAFIPGVSSALTISTFMLFGMPPQIAKSTFQIGGVGLAFGGLRQLMRSEKLHREYLLIFSLLCVISGYIGGSILVTIPTDILVKLTGLFMIVFLIVNLLEKDLGIISKEITKRRRWLGYGAYFGLNIFGSVFPMGIGVAYQFFYTYVFRMTILESKIIGKITYIPFLFGLVIPVYLSGFYDLTAILLFMVGSYIGSRFGIKYGLRVGNTTLKKIIMVWLALLGIYFIFFA